MDVKSSSTGYTQQQFVTFSFRRSTDEYDEHLINALTVCSNGAKWKLSVSHLLSLITSAKLNNLSRIARTVLALME